MNLEEEVEKALRPYKERVDAQIDELPDQMMRYNENTKYKEADTQAASIDLVMYALKGGKRYRGILTLLAAEILGEKDVPFAHIPEILHAASLAKDDMEDNATERRDRKPLHHEYSPALAQNITDVMLFLYEDIVEQANINHETIDGQEYGDMTSTMLKEMRRLTDGQQHDIFWSKNKYFPSEDEYWQMVDDKTGSLIRFAVLLGARYAEGAPDQMSALQLYATDLARAYQIRDDIIDLDEDIMEGKRTLMVVGALAQADEFGKGELMRLLDKNDKTQEDVAAVRNLFNRYDVITKAQHIANQYSKSAILQLKLLDNGHAKQNLELFAKYAAQRAH